LSAVVSDTSPIRALAHLNLLNLIAPLYGQVIVPLAVVRELQHPAPRFQAVDASLYTFFQAQVPQNQSQVQQFLLTLNSGESEALALALEVQAGLLLMDETAGRAIARQLGLTLTGTLGVLLDAKTHGLIPLIRPLIDDLENNLGFFISAKLRADVLRLAGE
jgi:predicted nucleic acid-binding protein